MLAFERRFLPDEDIGTGWFSEKYLPHLTFVVWFVFLASIALFGTASLPLAILSLPLARLMALDMVHMVLPDVYTLPLVFLGVLSSTLFDFLPWQMSLIGMGLGFGLPFLFAVAMDKITGARSGLGGGDIKFMAAAGAWLGVNVLVFIPLSCLLALVASFFFSKTKDIPFGPALILVFWTMLIFPHLFTGVAAPHIL